MKKVGLVIFFTCCVFNPVFAQTGTWTWISGSNAVNSTAVFGTQGVGSVNNRPPAIYDAIEWKDKSGNLWLYGGTTPLNTDLWKFNPANLEWTWMKGNGSINQAVTYGTKGVAASSNTPGQRSYTAQTWVDTSGALWLMGGSGAYDDMWKYDIGTNLWTWMDGTYTNGNSVHGTMGTANAANTPGNRYSDAATWTDSLNNLWLFGGFGWQDDGAAGGFTDLWKYNIATGNWTWMKGSQYINIAPVYGTKGTAAVANIPGGRFPYSKWKDTSGNFWIMGGLDWNVGLGLKNDLWKYNYTTNNWAWMHGPNTLYDVGIYTTACTPTTTGVPQSRWYNRAAVTDNGGGFWLFGGFGNDSNFNDLWVFDPSTTRWNIAKGPFRSKAGSYGTKGVSSAANMPPSRGGSVAWWGNDNRFYMFGGQGANSSTIYGDLWMFSPDTTCTPTANRALPIELLSFNAIYKEKITSITWSTASETNNNFFTVERADPHAGGELQFMAIGTMKGAGNSTAMLRYQFTDHIPIPPGMPGRGPYLYYRLKQTDFDGQYAYSDIVAVKIKEEDDYLLFPNPAGNKISVYGLRFTGAELKIYNVLGKVVLSTPQSSSQGWTEVDVSNLSPGIHFLELSGEGGNVVKKFVKE